MTTFIVLGHPVTIVVEAILKPYCVPLLLRCKSFPKICRCAKVHIIDIYATRNILHWSLFAKHK